jgi:hypothetical protein
LNKKFRKYLLLKLSLASGVTTGCANDIWDQKDPRTGDGMNDWQLIISVYLYIFFQIWIRFGNDPLCMNLTFRFEGFRK